MRVRLFSTLRQLALFLCISGFSLLAGNGYADSSSTGMSQGQVVYVPVYSHIYAGDRENPIYLAANLSIRNTDSRYGITIIKADYYDSNGKLIKNYLDSPVTLNSMSSTRYVIKESDKSGGFGASFIVQWKSEKPVNPPLIEAVMISTRSALGISFNSRGQVLH